MTRPYDMSAVAAGPRPVIDMVGVTRVFPGPPEVRAVGPVDLTVRTGEYLAVLGASGSGKSTLLSLIGLLDRPTSGSYDLDGISVAAGAEELE